MCLIISLLAVFVQLVTDVKLVVICGFSKVISGPFTALIIHSFC